MNNIKNSLSGLCIAIASVALLAAATFSTGASASLAPVIIDDFEDGDTSDWGFFGGNNAGGGGGPLGDRPQAGDYYLSTGWGGEGTASGFYGGMFRNFDNAAQVAPPSDPWFNVWVYKQSDTTADEYTLEITLREDLDGDGWTSGSEDSFRLDATFSGSDFNDEWVLISAPLSSFADQFTGGDGTFNGNLDEIVIVVAGVNGASGSAVEVDFDQLSFTSGGPPSVVFDDMEHGSPFDNGWFTFTGSVGGGGLDANSTDLPPVDGGAFSLQTGWGSGGVPGFYGGFGRNRLLDMGSANTFNFWINPDAGQDYTLEINLQDDDNGDGVISSPEDDEFQYNCVISPTGPCAISGGGWQLVSIPLTDFFDDNSFLTGGNGELDAIAVAKGGNGELASIVVAVIGGGTDASFRTDYWAFTEKASIIIDDFEEGLPSGIDSDGVPIGFYTFSDGSPVAIATTDAPPAPVPGATADNNVMALTGNVAAFAGFIHGFENDAVDTWTPQDWSGSEGLQFWFYGQNTGTTLFVDILDNRNPGSTTDDAERYSVSFIDNFVGWQLLAYPFSSFERKEVGNGAPNDGFTLTEVHGWAIGMLATPGEVTYYADDAALYGTAEIPDLAISFASNNYGIDEGTTSDITVSLNRPMNSEDPAQVSVDFMSADGSAIPGTDYTAVSGTLTFVNGGPSEQTFSIETFDNSKFAANKSIGLALQNPVDVAPGATPMATAFIIEDDEFDPNLVDDFEKAPDLWQASGGVMASGLVLPAHDPMARPGQDATEGVLQIEGPENVAVEVSGNYCNNAGNNESKNGNAIIPVTLFTTDSFDALSVDHTTVTLGGAIDTHVDKKTGLPRRHEEDADGDGDLDLVFHFRAAEAGLDCDADSVPLNGLTYSGQPITTGGSDAAFIQDFALGRDWSTGDALTFWYYGTGSGLPVTVQLKDNRAPDPGPGGWEQTWSDEFNEPAGTPPNPDNWTFETGDGSLNGIPGWGNEELQYYTDDPANAATDGLGNMVLTVRESDGSLDCYYGPCDYTSARLISKDKAEFAYGRIEARIKVPEGGGIWPAFWSLGTDIDLVNWPQTGEIDFMEFVGRLPNEIFGTIHGPGYSGGDSYGNVYDFGEPVFNDYHTFTVEWEPDSIRWYVDGILYHTAMPADVSPNEWVFNDPVFLLLNVALGGNFGGDVDPDIVLPQSMAIDYIRIWQAADTAERFDATFTDDVAGWRQVEVPFTEFTRSATQPAGAPDDGLGLTEVWGYGFALPQGGSFLLDQVQLQVPPAPTEIIVSNTADSGEGSLRQALATIASGGTITFEPALAGGTLALTSGPLIPTSNVIVDGSGAPGISIDGGGVNRLLVVDPGIIAIFKGLTFSNGFGFQLAGGILNNGTLTLDHVTVTANTMTTDAGDFWQGGGGIYNGMGSTFTLVDSTVSNNSSGYSAGGVYSFFGTTTVIQRSTISGNIAQDVGGGLRTLGELTVLNSTISGNTSVAWHGGAAFITDGNATVQHSTITGNNAPGGTAGGLFVGTFGDSAASLDIGSSVVTNNGDFGCFLAPFGAGAVSLTSSGSNVFSDATCNPVASDQVVADPGIGILGDNGGPTETHPLLPGSPAIDAAELATCPATDQRGVGRPQGAGCDAGAFEF